MKPFTLSETKTYLDHKNINYSNEQILSLYMCLGGIPFYLNFVEKGLSAVQNVNNICFSKKGTLYDEFELLFASLFKKRSFISKTSMEGLGGTINCSKPFVIDKKYANHIINREKLYCKVTKTNKQIFHSMIVSGGLKKSMYSEEIIASYATLNDLFKA